MQAALVSCGVVRAPACGQDARVALQRRPTQGRRICPPLTGPPLAVQVMLSSEKLADEVDVAHVASRTDGFSGSDLKALCTAAAMAPLRELLAASGKSAKVGLALRRTRGPGLCGAVRHTRCRARWVPRAGSAMACMLGSAPSS